MTLVVHFVLVAVLSQPLFASANVCDDETQCLEECEQLFNTCTELRSLLVGIFCVALDFTPIPVAGSLCTVANGFAHDDPVDVILGGVFGVLDAISLGMSHYIKAATADVAQLARMVQKGGKIIQAIVINSKEFKCLRLAAHELKLLKEMFSGAQTFIEMIQNYE